MPVCQFQWQPYCISPSRNRTTTTFDRWGGALGRELYSLHTFISPSLGWFSFRRSIKLWFCKIHWLFWMFSRSPTWTCCVSVALALHIVLNALGFWSWRRLLFADKETHLPTFCTCSLQCKWFYSHPLGCSVYRVICHFPCVHLIFKNINFGTPITFELSNRFLQASLLAWSPLGLISTDESSSI